jgi:hypothetical protein
VHSGEGLVVLGRVTNTPALLTRVSTRPNRSVAAAMTRSAVVGSAMSPWTVTRPGSCEGAMLREVATTA